MKKGYTIIEVLIVLAIIGVLLALSMAGLTQLNRVLQADQASKDFISIIKETKNFAKNNNVSQETDRTKLLTHQFGYKLDFSGGTIKRSLCNKVYGASWQGASCPDAIDLKPQTYSNIIFKVVNCDAVIFENLTETVAFMYSGLETSINKCEIDIRFADDNSLYRVLTFNSLNGDYSIEYK